ncbi:hypothetical protein HWN40_07105 [Methanolobus zinderi]|uniref:Uncharacterized protein n=1 Tax=Methanolobus zinderi TaxID=536044 RepID=A0A7D5I4W7_9EURY|nr:hypothetical protein [Methanolobus zinderi]QLC50024.1 hypothetical protein HWN40_07105 [Methanolobus zinderi]
MNSLKKTMLAFVLLLIVAAGVLAIWWDSKTHEMYQDSFQSSYNYEISIKTNETLDNLTLYLPLPVLNGSSSIGEEFVTRDFYESSPGWNFSLVDTMYGPMLSVETETLRPVYRSRPIPISDEPGSESPEAAVNESGSYSEKTPILVPVDFYASQTSDSIIDTRYPLGNEPVLRPKFNLTESEDTVTIQPPEGIDPQYYDYEGLIFARYEASSNADVEIHISVEGFNEGWELGWTSNDYRDSVDATLTGPQDGWVSAEGNLVTGDGVYKE